MNELTSTYSEFKQELDKAMHQAAEAFVKIGYLLRKARETDVLSESGYANVNEFAKNEYGLSPDQVSRYIAINERFSIGGYAPELREDMKGYGIGKLQIMLTLPDEVVEVIPQDVTKQEVAEIQKEVKQEQSITDIEVMLEEKQVQPVDLNRPLSPLEMFYLKYFYEHQARWEKLFDALDVAEPEAYDREIIKAICPSGIGVLRARVPGKGMMMLTFRGKDKSIVLLDVRSGERVEYSWDDMQSPFVELYLNYVGTKEEVWFAAYQEPLHREEQKKEPDKMKQSGQQDSEEQKKAEIAPVQTAGDLVFLKSPAEESDGESTKKDDICMEKNTEITADSRANAKPRHIEAAEGAIEDIKRYMKAERWADAIVSAEALLHHLRQAGKE